MRWKIISLLIDKNRVYSKSKMCIKILVITSPKQNFPALPDSLEHSWPKGTTYTLQINISSSLHLRSLSQNGKIDARYS